MKNKTSKKAVTKKKKPAPKMAHIVIYAEDFRQSVWEEYCEIAGQMNVTMLKIPFDKSKVKTS